MIPLAVGTGLALIALSYVLAPLVFGVSPANEIEPVTAQPESSRNPAVEALREIEFDRATGKLSDSDYTALKASYTRAAIDAMRAGEGSVCARCGPRPESNALFCSNCGDRLEA